ncbi:hypothetical protein K0040_13810 [Terrisporobacter petrolearius]|nr:hypothetical protein [Terrisporobacter petrolearius]MCC3865344.1 hypothetical protein [Terrisporobacter petrolearius]
MEKAYVYVRNWNLLEYDLEVLAKYDLKKMNYWYIGSTSESLENRDCKFKYQMIKQQDLETENGDHYNNNKTRIFINNLIIFYRTELKLSENDIDQLVFNHYETIEVDLNYIEELKVYEHQLLESKVIEQYMLISNFNKQYKVLSTKDGYMKIEQDNTKVLALGKDNRPDEFSSTIELKFDVDTTTNTINKTLNIPTELEKIHGYLKQYIKQLQQDDIIKEK